MKTKVVKDGIIITLEKKSDILYLDKLIKSGDIIGIKDFRSLEKGEKGDKKLVYLEVKIEKKEPNVQQGCIRILGEITKAPEFVKKGYHGTDICIGKDVKLINRKLTSYEKEIIKKAESLPSFSVLIVAMDNKEASFGEVIEGTINHLFDIRNKSYKKEISENEEYYQQIIKKIKELMPRYDYILVASPGFYKEYVTKKLQEKDIKVFEGECSVTGITGIREVVNRGLIEKIKEYSVLKEENDKLNEFFTQLLKNPRKVVYGKTQVKEALEMGAVEELLIAEEDIDQHQNLIELAQKYNTKIKIISKMTSRYNELKGFGGIVGILRYEI